MSRFAFVFPGQGSQSVGMLDVWLAGGQLHPAVSQTLVEASEALGYDMGQLIAQGPKERLDLTVQTQPAMLAADIACYRVWLAEGGAEPALVAGHSLGEYAALVAAGALTLADALPLVRLRAEAMQDAVPAGQGGMAAILGLDAAAVRAGCAEAAAAVGKPVEAVNFNDPKQIVIAGTKAAVARACEVLKAQGAKRALPLSVSAPFHSSLMKPAAERLKARLADTPIATPRIPVINNIDVADSSDAATIRDALYRQAFGPVRWVETIEAMASRGITHVVECGPGKALSGMVKRIDATLVTGSLSDPVALSEVKGMSS